MDRKTGKVELKCCGALPECNWVKHREKLTWQVDGRRGVDPGSPGKTER